jgi:ABC-type nitrate/sulfonate/bicarbonate transport system substrate-binding protein
MVGHSVGVSTLGSAPHYCVGLLADKYGVPMDKIDVQTLKTNPNIVATIAGNRIDAAITPSTFALSLTRNNQGKLLGWVGDESPWQLGAAYTTTKVASERTAQPRNPCSPFCQSISTSRWNCCAQASATWTARPASTAPTSAAK